MKEHLEAPAILETLVRMQTEWIEKKKRGFIIGILLFLIGVVVVRSGYGFVTGLGVMLAGIFTIIPAPYFKKYGKLPGLIAFVDGVTAAAVGAITGAVIVLAKRSIFDIPTALLALGTVLLLWKLKKLPEPVIVAGAALIGIVAYPLVRH